MAKTRFNLRDTQLQARLGLISSVAAGVFVLVLAFLVLENFNPIEKTVGYNPQGKRYLAIVACSGLSAFLGAVGFGFGFSSLGHKRNTRQRESWLGLLIGAFTVSLTIVLFVFFRIFGLAIVT